MTARVTIAPAAGTSGRDRAPAGGAPWLAIVGAALGCRDADRPTAAPPAADPVVIALRTATLVVTTPPGWARRDRRMPGPPHDVYAVELAPPDAGAIGVRVSMTCAGGCADVAANLDTALADDVDGLRASQWRVEVQHQRRDATGIEYQLRARAGASTIVRGRTLRYQRGWPMAVDCQFDSGETEVEPAAASVAALLALCRQIEVHEPRAAPPSAPAAPSPGD